MLQSFFFYDLETSGFNPREARIMQFAGQRTSIGLEPIGEPVNVLIKITEDVLPDPQAIMVTGITPQKTIKEGITEAQFLKRFSNEVATPGTIFVGYNTVRFDDEFMRYLHYRNFYDPYEWQWQDDRSRWDLLDAVRMMRALRPEGINWPSDEAGQPTNRLELLASINNLEHSNAHDALSDVNATIALAKLIAKAQPKLFSFLVKLRDKKQVAEITRSGQPFIYTSGKYPGEYEKTTVVSTLSDHPERQGVLVYDLRFDPEQFAKMSAKQLAEAWRYNREREDQQLPIKTLQFNRCPAVAPLSVLEVTSPKQLEHIQLDMKVIEVNRKKLEKIEEWPKRILEALKLLDAEQNKRYAIRAKEVDAQLYDGFFDKADRNELVSVRQAEPAELNNYSSTFHDVRLKKLLPLYKARNFPDSLSAKERDAWHKHCAKKLSSGGEDSQLAKFMSQISAVKSQSTTTSKKKLIKELIDYAESIMIENDGESQ